MKKDNIPVPRHRVVWWLALQDLRHELLMALNLMVGIAAIIAPLLLLFGIKFGVIETMRDRLLDDPRNLEIRPLTSRAFDRKWFETIRKEPRVAVAIPMTRKLASTVILKNEKGQSIKADLVPTVPEDPMIEKNGATIPKGHEAVLGFETALALGVDPGDKVHLIVTRYIHRKLERASVELKITGILQKRATFFKTLYVPLALAEKIERYKDGMAVEELGWNGSSVSVHPHYDGVFVVVAQPIDRVEQIKLTSGTGFASIKEISPSEASKIAHYDFEDTKKIYFLKSRRNRITDRNIEALRIRLRGRDALLDPWIEPMKVSLNGFSRLLVAAPKRWKLPENRYCSGDLSVKEIELVLHSDYGSLAFPVKILSCPEKGAEKGVLYAEAGTAGRVSLFRERKLIYDPKEKRLVPGRRSYAAFRIYARGLDDVEPLKKLFEAKGIPVSTQAERIHDVKTLDRYLTLIFWLIAAIGIAGGMATLSTSLYGAVERKRRDLAVLRLLGLSKISLFRFPVYQGLMIGVGGTVLAFIFYGLMSTVTNRLFSAYLQPDESFCRLALWHMGVVVGIVGFIAMVSSFAAAVKATRADPAEALREE